MQCSIDGGPSGNGSDFLDHSSTWDPAHDTADDEAASSARAIPRLILALECRALDTLGCRVMLDGLDAITIARTSAPPHVVPSPRVERHGRTATLWVRDHEASRQHCVVRRRGHVWQVEDLGSRNGTVVNGERVKSARLHDGDVLEAGGALLVFRASDTRAGALEDRDLARRGEAALPVLPAFQTLNVELDIKIQQARKIAPSLVPVLVRGETGTGKELMAHAIHAASGRTGPFVPVNCGALPRELVESELFGFKRGAFSGAHEDREGLIRRAHKGTLFLDEIAELPPDSQVALLRVLQEGEVRPVGASESIKVDVRVIAATHQDLELRIASGQFRQDLYGRIAGFEVALPALRERREDLGSLISAILGRLAAPGEPPIGLHKSAARALMRYAWPLNVRELEQSLTAAVALCEGGQVRVDDLPAAVRDYAPPAQAQLSDRDRVLRGRLVELMECSAGNIAAVGRAMQRAPIQIRRWCQRLDIDPARYR